MRRMRWLLAGALAMSGLTVTGCDSTSCGEGTSLVDGVCVPDTTTVCGAGTVPNADGMCVPESTVTCGAGTMLNTTTGACDPDVVCATGTVAMAGECVPDGSVICADGTEFDATTGTCILTTGACGEGTTLVDGECIPNDDALLADVFAAAEPDDPSYDGTPGEFFPPAVGAQTSLGGCITPADFDSTVEGSEADIDFFTFATSGPGYYRIRADGLGGLAASFAVFSADDNLANQGFVRIGMNMTGDTSERFLYLPQAGSYVLMVFDTRSVLLDYLAELDQFVIDRPVGTPDTCYHVTVEGTEIPTPTALSTPTTSTVLGAMPSFYSATPSADPVAFRAEVSSDVGFASKSAVLAQTDSVISVGRQVFEDGTWFAASDVVATGDTALIVVDHVFHFGLDPVSVDLTVGEIGELPGDGSDVTVVNDADDPFGAIFTFDATAGDVMHLVLSGASFANIREYSPGFINGITLTADSYFRVATTGTQFVRVVNTSVDDEEEYVFQATLTSQTPVAIPVDTPTAVTLVDTKTFVTLDTSAHQWSVFTVGDFGGNTTAADLSFYEADLRGVLDSAGVVDSEPSFAGSFSRIYGPNMGASYLVAIEDSTAFDDGDSVTVGFARETFTNIVGTAGTMALPGETVAADGVTNYLVQGEPNGTLDISFTGATGVDVSVDELDYDATPLQTINDTAAGEAEMFTGIFGENRYFAFAVSAGAAGGSYDIDLEVTPPPYAVTAGSTAFTSICPSDGGAGTLIEDFTAPIAYSTFTGFDFFGTATTGIRVSEYGFLTFDTTYDGTDEDSPSAIGTPGGPDQMVAAFWDSFFVIDQACVMETADQVIVEWRGLDLFDLVIGGVETHADFQAILDNTTGTIEIVYAPTHEMYPLDATVGVENADGSVGIAGPTSGPNMSTLFTPAAAP